MENKIQKLTKITVTKKQQREVEPTILEIVFTPVTVTFDLQT